jgi:hypothetical protein
VSDQVILIAGTVLGVGGLLVAAMVLRPRPHSLLELAYLVLPLAGAVILAVLVWRRG